jgi:hypothetical protein
MEVSFEPHVQVALPSEKELQMHTVYETESVLNPVEWRTISVCAGNRTRIRRSSNL